MSDKQTEERRSPRKAEDKERALARAVSDVLDGTCTMAQAAEGSRVSKEKLRAAVKKVRDGRGDPMRCAHDRDPRLCPRCSR